MTAFRGSGPLPDDCFPFRKFGLVILGLVIIFLPSVSSRGRTADLVEKSRQGSELMRAGRFGEAIPIYQELVRAIPNNPGLMMNLGLALHMVGQDRKAIHQFESALKLDPNILPAHLFLGASHLRLGEPAKAVAPLEKVVQAQPEDREARQMLADALFSVERYGPAAEHYRKLTELDPGNPKFWYRLGRCYEALSTHAFGELEEVAPESAYWFVLVADSRVAQRQFGGAFFFYRKALEADPTLPGVHAALAGVYRETGHPNWATVEEEKERDLGAPECGVKKLQCDFMAGRYQELVASARDQKSAESYYWQSRAYNELAVDALARLARLPPSPEVHALMAEAHRNQRRVQESIKEWRAALELARGDPWLEQQLGMTLRMAADNIAALQIFEGLLKKQPDSAELNYLVGDTLLDMQKVEEAVPYLKKAVERDPSLLSAQKSLALAYLQLNQGQQAIPHLKAALAIDDDGSLHYQLARGYQGSGQMELAREMLKEYQKLNALAMEVRKELKEEFEITPP